MKKLLTLAATGLVCVAGYAQSQNLVAEDRSGWAISGCSEQNRDNDLGFDEIMDDNPSTYWHTTWSDANVHAFACPHYFVIDRGAANATNPIDGFGYLPRQDTGGNGYVTAYRLYVLSDITNLNTVHDTNAEAHVADNHASLTTFLEGKTPTKQGTFDINEGDASTLGLRQVTFDSSTSGRYVLFVIDNASGSQGNDHANCAEFYLYNNGWNITYTFPSVNNDAPTLVVPVLEGRNAADYIPAIDFFTPTGITETGDAAIVNENQTSFNVEGTWSFPMEFEKVYRVRLKPSTTGNKDIKYDGTNVLLQYTGNDNGDELDEEYLWYFKYVNLTDGVLKVTMHGLAKDDNYGITIGTTDNAKATLTETPTTLIVKPTKWESKIEGDFCLKHSEANNWINDRSSYFSTWSNSQAEGNDGSVLRLSSMTDNDFDLLKYCNSATDVEAAEANPSQEKIRPLLANYNDNDIDDYNIINHANAFAALGVAPESAVTEWNTFKGNLIHSGEFTSEQSASIVTAYQALVNSSANTPGGAHIKLSTNVVPADYMIVRLINNAYGLGRYGDDVNGNKTTWTLKDAEGGFYLYNENSGKYAKFPTADNAQVTPVASESDASIFVFDLYDAATARYGIKCVNTQGDNCYLYTSADEGVSEPNKIFRGAKAANSSWYLHASDAATATNEANIGANEDLANARANFLMPVGAGLGEYTLTTDPEGAYASAYERYKALPEEPSNAEKHAAAGALRAAFPNITCTLNMPQAGTYLRFKGAYNAGTLVNQVVLYHNTQHGTGNAGGSTNMTVDKNHPDAHFSDAASILYYDGQHLLNYSTGYYLYNDERSYPCFISITDMSEGGQGNMPLSIGIVPGASQLGTYQINYTGRDNNPYSIKINGASSTYWFADRTPLAAGSDINSVSGTEVFGNWFVSQINELPVAIHADGYGSFIAPVAVSFNAENPVYVGSVSGNVLTFEQLQGEVIAPNTPVIVKGTPSTTVNATIHYDYVASDAPATLAVDESTIRLEGKYIAENKAAETNLSTFAKTSENATLTDDSTVKLNKVDDGSVIPVNSLLLTLHNNSKLIDDGGETATVNLEGNNVTGISAIEFRNLDGTREIYDLQGRRVSKAGHGVYIVNGKKVYVK